MYKATYANGDEWYEWIKMGVRDFRVLKIHGDGSHSIYLYADSLKIARTSTRIQNNLYTSKSALTKVADMPEGQDYLTKEDYARYKPHGTKYPEGMQV